MIKFLKTTKRTLIFYVLYLNAVIKKKHYSNKRIVFLIGTPWHGNMGDQAIALAEFDFINKNTSKRIIEIPSQYMMWYKSKWQKVIGNSPILIHGGGFIGSLWPDEDKMIRDVLISFSNNNILVLPQTIYFSDTKSKEVEEYRRILYNCRNTVICARERYSYELASELDIPNVKLIPDMVTYFKQSDFELIERNNSYDNTVLMCLRNDHEKVFDVSLLEETISKNSAFRFVNTDTFEEHSVYPFQRRKSVTKKINEFSCARIVITDRLHGMVFSALAGTPCLVMSNCNNKIVGVYEWISNNKNIIFLTENNSHDICEAFSKLLDKKREKYNNEKVSNLFNELELLIERL